MTTLMRVQDLAQYLRCSPKTIYRWIDQGVIPAQAVVRIGTRSIRLDVSEFPELAGLLTPFDDTIDDNAPVVLSSGRR